MNVVIYDNYKASRSAATEETPFLFLSIVPYLIYGRITGGRQLATQTVLLVYY
jgi:hypothetical protein